MDEIDIKELLNIVKLSTDPERPFQVISRESSKVEFKESFNPNNIASYAKTMAAFANSKGGWIIFGVKDQPYKQLVGLAGEKLEKFDSLNVERFTQFLKDYFEPEIEWAHRSISLSGHTLGVIKVTEITRKPCICCKLNDSCEDSSKKPLLSEGEIYYRYGGQTTKIKYSELRSIISLEVERVNSKWLAVFKSIGRIGVENLGLLDVSKGVISGVGKPLLIENELLKEIQFIKEGEFEEKSGSPTLKLVGEIKSLNPNEVSLGVDIVPKSISQIEIINAFLTQEKVVAPEEYIKQIVAETTAYLPIYYFIQLSNFSVAKTIDTIQGMRQRINLKKKILNRLEGQRIEIGKLPTIIRHPSTIQTMQIYEALKNQSISPEDTNQECVKLCKAILYLSDEEIIQSIDYYRKILKGIFTHTYPDAITSEVTMIRKAICRLDEVAYFS